MKMSTIFSHRGTEAQRFGTHGVTALPFHCNVPLIHYNVALIPWNVALIHYNVALIPWSVVLISLERCTDSVEHCTDFVRRCTQYYQKFAAVLPVGHAALLPGVPVLTASGATIGIFGKVDGKFTEKLHKSPVVLPRLCGKVVEFDS